MANCGTSDSMQDVFCRLNKGMGIHYSVDQPLGRAFGDLKSGVERDANNKQSARYDAFRNVYPDATATSGLTSPRFRRDQTLFERYLYYAAGEIAQSLLMHMKEVVSFFESEYIAATEGEQRITSLARSIRAWLPFVSHAPFIELPEQDYRAWSSEVQTDPPPLEPLPELENRETPEDVPENGAAHTKISDTPPGREDLQNDAPAGTPDPEELERVAPTAQAVPKPVPESEEDNIQVETSNRTVSRDDFAFLPWRSILHELPTNSARILALKSESLQSDYALQERLYDLDPILIVLPAITKPAELIELLMLQPAERDKRLHAVVMEAIGYLRKGLNEFEQDVKPIIDFSSEQRTEVPDDVPWQNLSPIRMVAKDYLLLPHKYDKNSPIYRYAGEVLEEEDFTLQDKIRFLFLASTILIAVLSAGGVIGAIPLILESLAVVAEEGVVLSISASENVEREILNRFAIVDAGLEVASRPHDLSSEVLFTAGSFLITLGIGQAARLLRKSIIRRIPAQDTGPVNQLPDFTAARRQPSRVASPTTPPRPRAENKLGTRGTNNRGVADQPDTYLPGTSQQPRHAIFAEERFNGQPRDPTTAPRPRAENKLGTRGTNRRVEETVVRPGVGDPQGSVSIRPEPEASRQVPSRAANDNQQRSVQDSQKGISDNRRGLKTPNKVNSRHLKKIAERNNSTDAILSGIQKQEFWSSASGEVKVYMTETNQLVGKHKALINFRKNYQFEGEAVYKGWHSHHIVEEKHLENTGIREFFPGRDDLPCVLLPSKAHSQRIGGVLRPADTDVGLSPQELYSRYYITAYQDLGVYTGVGTGAQIDFELTAIVKRMLGLE